MGKNKTRTATKITADLASSCLCIFLQNRSYKDTSSPSILQMHPPPLYIAGWSLPLPPQENRLSDPWVMSLGGVWLLGGKKRHSSTCYSGTRLAHPQTDSRACCNPPPSFPHQSFLAARARQRCGSFTLPGATEGGKVLGCRWFVIRLHGWYGVSYDHSLVFFLSFFPPTPLLMVHWVKYQRNGAQTYVYIKYKYNRSI